MTKDSKRLYLSIGEKCTWNAWLDMCKHEQNTRVRTDAERRAGLKRHLANLKPIVYEMADAGTFTLPRLKNKYNGISNDDITIYSVWDEYIKEKTDKEKAAIFRDLALFLFMYLGDGQNLADTLRLEYDGWYFATHGKQMRFLRHKTRERNEDSSEVIFPITPEIQTILNKYANKPKLGERVFPIMSKFITPEQEIWVVQRYNKYIRKHMAKIAELLKMEQRPSPTWARHSFATNLNNTGHVP